MALDLEDFSALPEPVLEHAPTLSLDEAEAERSAAYEQGYAAGWDDAAKAEAETQNRIGTEFARHLQEMSFTFHEARAHVIEAVLPLFRELTDTFLPQILQDAMGPRLVEVLEPLAAQCADTPVLITVAPGGKDALAPYLDAPTAGVIRIVEEPTLAEGQAFLRLGHVERKIDLSGALARVRTSLDSLGQLNEKALSNG